jgi:EmrB/QacA subfamily drug resistance transporter
VLESANLLVLSALKTVSTTFRSVDRAGARIAQRKHANYFLICAYTLLVAMEAWTSSAINVLLVDIAGNMGASSDEASWVITVYSAAAAVSIVLSHNICKITGERLYILLAALMFGFASCGCAVSGTLASLLIFRVLQGLAGGAFMSRTLVLLMTHFAPEQRSRPLRYYLLILFVIGRVAAPLVSGYLSDLFSWKSLFWVDAIASLVAAWVFCVAPNREKLLPPPARRKMHFDFFGAALLMAGVAGIQLTMSRGEVDGWFGSLLIRAAFLAGIFATGGFIAWQLSPSNRHPLVHMRHLLTRNLFVVVLLGVLLGTLFSAVIYVFPFYLRVCEAHSAFQTGCLLSVVGIPMVGLGLIAPHFVEMVGRWGGRKVLTIGLGLQILSAALMIPLMTSDTPDIYLLPSLALSGAFIFFTAVGLAVAGFALVPIRRISNARTLYFGARQLGNSIGISLGIILLDRRQAFHSQRLLESFFLRNRSSLAASPDMSMQSNVQELGKAVMHQSLVLSYQDMFAAVIAVSLIAMACAWMLSGSTPSTRLPQHEDSVPEIESSAYEAEFLALE